MSIQEVIVFPRETLGKGHSKRLRKSGLIPSVVYGLDEGSYPISVEPKTITKVLRSEKGMNSVLDLRLHDTDATRHVMIKSVDRHPLKDHPIHVDFLRVDMDKKITAIIPLNLQGTPEGVKLGGLLTIVRHEVEVECLPKDLPGVIRIDVSELKMDEALRIADLPQTEGVSYTLGPKRTIAVVHPPDREEEITDEDDDE